MKSAESWRRMLRPDVVLAVLAISTGVAGAVFASRYVAARADATETSLRQRYAAKAVVVAATDLARGDALDAGKLAVRQMPRDFLPADAVPVERAAELIGARVAIDIKRGTPVMQSAMRQGSDATRMSQLLRDGRRALTIAVDQVSSLAGHLTVGDSIDLYYSRSEGSGAVLVPLLQRIAVLAVGDSLASASDVGADPGGAAHFSTVTLALTAEEAARIVLAQQTGSLSVVLRGMQDDSPTILHTRSSRTLLERAAPGGTRAASIADRLELIVGGSGGLAPERSWLQVGSRPAGNAGEQS